MNGQIRASEVRLIDEKENMLGVMPIQEAVRLAQDKGVDVVEVQPTANPPVCRLMDYKKFLYRQAKAKKGTSSNAADKLKSVRISMRISDNDLQTKAKRSEGFLNKGHKVKVQLVVRGRENAHRELIQPQIDKFVEHIDVPTAFEVEPKRYPGGMFFILRKK